MVYGLVSLDLHLRGPQAHSYTNDKDYLARCSPAPSAVLLCHTKHDIPVLSHSHIKSHTATGNNVDFSVLSKDTLTFSQGSNQPLSD